MTRSLGIRVGVGGRAVAVEVAVLVGVALGLGVALGVEVSVGCGVAVGVAVSVGRGVALDVTVLVAVGEGVDDGVDVGVSVAVAVDVSVFKRAGILSGPEVIRGSVAEGTVRTHAVATVVPKKVAMILRKVRRVRASVMVYFFPGLLA